MLLSRDVLCHISVYGNKQIKNHYIMEYSLEYGFLRLSTEARKKVNVPVKVVTLGMIT